MKQPVQHTAPSLGNEHELALTPWLWNIAILAMGACIGVVVAALAGSLVPGAYVGFLPVLCVLIGIESLYTRAVGIRVTRSSQARFVYLAAEWIIIVVVLKVFLEGLSGFRTLASNIALWLTDFLTFIFEPVFLVSLMTLVTVWFACRLFAGDLAPLALSERQLASQQHVSDERGGMTAIRDTFAGHMIVLGIFIAAALALIQLIRLIQSTGDQIRQPGAVPGGAVVLYFALGLALLAHTRVRASANMWRREGVTIEPNTATVWSAYGLVLVVALTIVVLILPIGQPLTLFQSVSNVMRSISMAVLVALTLIWSLLYFLFQLVAYAIFALISALFGNQQPTPPVFTPQPVPPIEQATTGQGGSPWLIVVLIALITALIVVAAYYLVSHHLSLRDGLRQMSEALRVLSRRLRDAWLLLRRALANPRLLWQALRSPAPESATASPSARISRGARPNLRQMTARALIRYYYAQLLQRGDHSGVPRGQSQTPSEYARLLDQRAPEAAEDVEHLTDAFIEARYSTHDVTDQQASAVREWFEHTRAALRRRRKAQSR